MANAGIEALKIKLNGKLPGREAQFRMAPSYRPTLEETVPLQTAGVMLLLYLKDNEFCFPLIKRPEYDGAHSGQISFPGGKRDAGDKSIVETALRECQEEIGIQQDHIEIVGRLSQLYIPVSRSEVHPVVGFLSTPPVFIPQASEVVSIIETAVSRLQNKNTLESKTIQFNGENATIPFFNIDNHMVWGATAMILSEFLEIWEGIV